MLSLPEFQMEAQISPWIAWNWGFLAKTRKWNVHFHRKSFQRENRTSTFSIFQLFPGIFQWNAQKYVPFRIHPNRNFRNFLVNGKRLTVISRENQWWHFPKRWQFSQAKVLNMGDEDPAKLMWHCLHLLIGWNNLSRFETENNLKVPSNYQWASGWVQILFPEWTLEGDVY